MIQKPLTATLEEQRGGRSTNGLQLDADMVAASFGAQVVGVDSPLPETAIALKHHYEEKPDSVTDHFTSPRDEEPPRLLLELAIVRLTSLQPVSKRRAKQVRDLIARLTEPLKAADDLVAILEREHFESIGDRWEQLRQTGRKISEGMDRLTGNAYAALMKCNDSEKTKVLAKSEVQSAHEALRRMSRWATQSEIEAAEKRLADARAEMRAAELARLADEQALEQANNAVRIAKGQLEGITLEMSRCEAAIKGENYFDAETGLSSRPRLYRDAW